MTAMNRNYKQSLKPDFIDRVCEQIEHEKVKYIMLHSSGDFYSMEYFTKWTEIARLNPNVKIDGFTRNLDINFKNCPDNLSLFFSVDHGVKTINKTAELFAYIIEFDRIPGHMEPFRDGRFCNSKCYKCKYCFNRGGNIYFVINLSSKRASRRKKLHKDQLLFKGVNYAN
jgi:hypothetical protein